MSGAATSAPYVELHAHSAYSFLDGAGRILVPPALRRYASLDRSVMLVGQGHKFEIWDEAQWSAQTAQTLAFPADTLPSELGEISL